MAERNRSDLSVQGGLNSALPQGDRDRHEKAKEPRRHLVALGCWEKRVVLVSLAYVHSSTIGEVTTRVVASLLHV